MPFLFLLLDYRSLTYLTDYKSKDRANNKFRLISDSLENGGKEIVVISNFTCGIQQFYVIFVKIHNFYNIWYRRMRIPRGIFNE